jgi:hypothetical protein
MAATRRSVSGAVLTATFIGDPGQLAALPGSFDELLDFVN